MTVGPTLDPATFLAAQRSPHADDHLALIALIREGLPMSFVERIADRIGLTAGDLGDIGVVAPRTLRHSRTAGRLSPAQSDRVARFFRVFAHAGDTFGSAGRARRWLDRPTGALGGERPADLLDTEEGTRLVDDLLWRIDQGLAA